MTSFVYARGGFDSYGDESVFSTQRHDDSGADVDLAYAAATSSGGARSPAPASRRGTATMSPRSTQGGSPRSTQKRGGSPQSSSQPSMASYAAKTLRNLAVTMVEDAVGMPGVLRSSETSSTQSVGMGAPAGGPSTIRYYYDTGSGLARPIDSRHGDELLGIIHERDDDEESGSPGRAYARPDREKLEALDARLAQLGTSSDSDYFARMERLIRKYNVPLPCVTIEYRNLNVSTNALKGSKAVPTVGSSFVNLARTLLFIKPDTTPHTILADCKGVLHPGRLTLMLGPPGCGKSTFLKFLSGRVHAGDTLDVTGDVTYNGHSFDEFNPIRTAAYIGQMDNHIPGLTVLDTLEFAHVCQNGGKSDLHDLVTLIEDAVEMNKGMTRATTMSPSATIARAREQDAQDELEFLTLLNEMKDARGIRIMTVLRMLGISHTKDTFVGDAMLRGVSGGERKRVTIGEMIIGGRTVFMMDEISTGLDSATLYNIVNTLGRITRGLKHTTVISLLAPPPEVYFLFDDLILMAQGMVCWHGPVGEVVSFFGRLGFQIPVRKDVPSFLQEVVTQTGQLEYAVDELLWERKFTERAFADGAKRFVMPITEVAAAFWQTPQGMSMRDQLREPFPREQSPPGSLKQGSFALTWQEAFWVVMRRQWSLMVKDISLLRGRLIQTFIIGLIIGGLFFQLPIDADGVPLFFGACFLMIMYVSMGAMVGLTTALTTKGVWIKHRANLFYPPWIHAATSAIVQIPYQAVDVTLWCLISYFMIGFNSGGGYWWNYWCILLWVNLSFGAMFRAIGHASPDGIAANTMGGLVLLVLIVMSGFTIPRNEIPDYWIWAYWLSPYAWAMRSLVVNEMTAPRWDVPYYNPSTGENTTLGLYGLNSFGFQTERKWVWAGNGYMTAYYVLMTCCSIAALKYLSGPAKIAAVPDEDELKKARDDAKARREALLAQEKVAPAKPSVMDHADDYDDDAVQSSIPFEKITLVWRDLKYFVPNPAAAVNKDAPPEIELLKGITGWAEPGQLTALMGGSGAGKTTLMDCVAGRKTVGLIKGDITVNGHEKEQATWSRVMGYVEQMDIHTPAQTILEALVFSARLRLPAETSQDAVRTYVDQVIDLVDLTEIMFNLVGVPGHSGLSVEQRKRLTIANEMVANPSVIFMDEPTSGLDARAASIVMRAVRNVGNSKRAVVVTIHQPSIEIFEAFDNLLLLQRGGRTTYFGPLGSESHKLVQYLQAVPGCDRMRDGANPATWMLEVTGGAVSVTAKAVDINWPDYYAESELCAHNAEYAEALVERDLKSKNPITVEGHGGYAATFGTQMRALWTKFFSAYWRMPSYNYIRYMMTGSVALIYGSIYYNKADLSNPETATVVQSVGGVVYLSVSFLGMSAMMAVMPLVGMERIVFYRERAASYYSPWAYGFVMSAVELPYQLAQAILFVCIMYPMLHFVRTGASFFFYLFMSLLSLMLYVALGMALMYCSPTQQLAQVSGSGLNFLFNIFNGYVIPYPSMARGWQWVNRISPTTWVIYGLVSDQLCNKQELVDGRYNPDGSPQTISQFMETRYGYKYSMRGWTLLIVIAYILFFRVVSILALRYISYLRR